MGNLPKFRLAIHLGQEIIPVANGAGPVFQIVFGLIRHILDVLFSQQILPAICVGGDVRTSLCSIVLNFTLRDLVPSR